jgi:hypothetical protein
MLVAAPQVIVPSPMCETSSPLFPTRRRRTREAYVGQLPGPSVRSRG